jgi:2-pyrone-4,6-dicarboxylate lactonase
VLPDGGLAATAAEEGCGNDCREFRSVDRHAPVRASSSACDTHVHVFDPERYPYARTRRYTPGAAPVAALEAHLSALGLGRVVLVQPSVYGTDHRCMLDALAVLGTDRARGVAVLDDAAGPRDINALDKAGIRSARLNLEVDRARDPEASRARLRALARQVPAHWCISIYGGLSLLADLRHDLAQLSSGLVVEHFGSARLSLGGTAAPGFEALLDLLGEGKAFIKFSGPYQISTASPDYRDVAPVARALAAAAPGRVLWGSNWPHTAGAHRTAAPDPAQVEPFRQEDDAHNFALLSDWLGEAARGAALTTAPGRVFFDEA